MSTSEYGSFVLGIIVGTIIAAPICGFLLAALFVRLLPSRTNVVRFPDDHETEGSRGG